MDMDNPMSDSPTPSLFQTDVAAATPAPPSILVVDGSPATTDHRQLEEPYTATPLPHPLIGDQPRSPVPQSSQPRRPSRTPTPSHQAPTGLTTHINPSSLQQQQQGWQDYSGLPASQVDDSSLNLSASSSSSASTFVSLLRRLSQQGQAQQQPAQISPSGGSTVFRGNSVNLYHAQSVPSRLHPYDVLNTQASLPSSPIPQPGSIYSPSPPYHGVAMSGGSDSSHSLQRGASSGSSGQYRCPNCSKTFARDDLLRRHLAREARAAAQPSLDRQKSCFECARSKARCDLEVPTCGRCRARGKSCTYGARSGNPNVRKGTRSSSGDNVGIDARQGQPAWGSHTATFDPNNAAHQWHTRTAGPGGLEDPNTPYNFGRHDAMSNTEDESDDSHAWSDTYRSGLDSYPRSDRSNSGSAPAAFDYQTTGIHQQNSEGIYSSFNAPMNTQHNPYHHHPSIAARAPGIDTSVPRATADDDEATPINRTAVMGPPLVTPTRSREGDAQALNARPQVPRLLTGARMPRPQGEAGLVSGRPLFSAQLDLSGWLEEPVIPSPLYRMGPSLSALGASAAQPFLLPTPTIAAPHGHALPSVQVSASQQGDTSASQHAQTAALNWWAAGPQERSAVDAQEVAQACAGHFTLYPGLMVLPDATSPVPPLFHRPWLAFSRLQTPAALAHVRIALAAYHVRLPASEAMIWDMIRSQASSIVSSYDTLAHSTDMEVFSATAALWFLVILLLMSTDPNSGQGVDEGMTDASLIGLSHLARLLLQRLQARELADKQGVAGQEDGKANPGSSSFLQWGFVETMRRTLFACYALFVLQRFRTTSPELQSQLAGAELVLDVTLPATASEFEAGDDLEWRAAQHVKITDAKIRPFGNEQTLTLRTLLQARSEAAMQSRDSGNEAREAEERKKAILAYFDRHDDFTNVCLTVSFGLDTRL